MYTQKYLPSFSEVVNDLWNRGARHMRYTKHMNGGKLKFI